MTFSGIGECKFRLATIAYHKYGDLSQCTPTLCIIYGGTSDFWVGRWVTVLPCFFDVNFPKGSLKKLTRIEKEKFKKVIEGAIADRYILFHQSDSKINYKPLAIKNS